MPQLLYETHGSYAMIIEIVYDFMLAMVKFLNYIRLVVTKLFNNSN